MSKQYLNTKNTSTRQFLLIPKKTWYYLTYYLRHKLINLSNYTVGTRYLCHDLLLMKLRHDAQVIISSAQSSHPQSVMIAMPAIQIVYNSN